jgi:hypothetical protein
MKNPINIDEVIKMYQEVDEYSDNSGIHIRFYENGISEKVWR